LNILKKNQEELEDNGPTDSKKREVKYMAISLANEEEENKFSSP
jgi:hypothetical protein